MDKPTCETCIYWFTWAQDDKRTAKGECRRISPSPVWAQFDRGESKKTYNHVIPKTLIDFWCGDHPDFKGYLDRKTALKAIGPIAELRGEIRRINPNKTNPPDDKHYFIGKQTDYGGVPCCELLDETAKPVSFDTVWNIRHNWQFVRDSETTIEKFWRCKSCLRVFAGTSEHDGYCDYCYHPGGRGATHTDGIDD